LAKPAFYNRLRIDLAEALDVSPQQIVLNNGLCKEFENRLLIFFTFVDQSDMHMTDSAAPGTGSNINVDVEELFGRFQQQLLQPSPFTAKYRILPHSLKRTCDNSATCAATSISVNLLMTLLLWLAATIVGRSSTIAL